MPSDRVTVRLSNVDWPLLARQKAALLSRCDEREDDPLTGILHLIDAVQDQAAAQLGESAVFPPDGAEAATSEGPPSVKVVINTTYGGFNVAAAAYEFCADGGLRGPLGPPDSLGISVEDHAYFDPDDEDDEAALALAARARRAFRTHPVLVAAVETSGDAAYGHGCRLKVVEIPFAGVDGWELHEHDGKEWIEEVGHTWR